MNYYNDIVYCCRDLLQNFPDAKNVLNYVNKRLSPAAQEKFLFGYFPDSKNLPMLESTVSNEALASTNIIYDQNSRDDISDRVLKVSPFENHNLIMPYKNVYGNIIALVGRSILDDDTRRELNISKYKNTSFDKSKHLFGLYEAKRSIINKNIAYIVEGQFDCITAQDKGLSNVVALGSSNMSFEQFALLSRYTNNLICLLDNDDAGQLGTQRIIKMYSKYSNIKSASIPKEYKDIDEYLKENSVDSLTYTLK